MALPTNVSDIPSLIIYEAGEQTGLIPLLLLTLFIIIWGGGYMANERKKGKADALLWGLIAGMVTTSISFILFLSDGIVNIATIGICLAVTIGIATFYFIASREQ